MGSTLADEPMGMGLGNQRVLAQIDKLRELNIGSIVPLPQLVVVGDQSSGKSSVLESLTGFSFPRAAGLCTRYATQITCARESHESVTISIIPRPDADNSTQERLRKFHRRVVDLNAADFGPIFDDANRVMGIYPIDSDGSGSGTKTNAGLVTFSEDILKIEITGPAQDHLTVIDVPGIFRTATPGLTTESDINLVNTMVRSYMKDMRTIILAVIPCNVDIATQEILKLAKDADPQGLRTMGVLTKPDLVTERATQQVVLDLVQGKRNDLKLGYCLVKNRGADDQDSPLEVRHKLELAFFRGEPWSNISSSGRVGIESLKKRLSELLQDISRREYPRVRADIQRKLSDLRLKLSAMGMSRSGEMAQRQYLGQMASRFEKVVRHSMDAHYDDDPIFNENSEMRLITRIIRLNEAFADTFARRGHTHQFEKPTRGHDDDDDGQTGRIAQDAKNPSPRSLTKFPELDDIVIDDPFDCPEPSKNTIMDQIRTAFNSSRGPELGTFSGALLGTIFKEQTKKWEDLVLSHASDAIVVVHQFIRSLLEETFQENEVLDELWETVLLEKLQEAYKKTMDRAWFLLDIEVQGKPMTYNHYFNSNLQKLRAARLQATLAKLELPALPADTQPNTQSDVPSVFAPQKPSRFGGQAAPVSSQFMPSNQQQVPNPTNKQSTGLVRLNSLSQLTEDKGNPQQVLEDLHDILQSYYKVSRKRFVDVVCQQVIDNCLISGPNSPLKVFSSELVFNLDAGKLEMIAGEAATAKQEREMLVREVDSLKAAMKILRG